MASIIRIILGIAVLAGAFIAKQKAAPAIQEGEDTAATITLWGQEMAPSSMTLVVTAFALIGVAMIVLGVLGLVKQRN